MPKSKATDKRISGALPSHGGKKEIKKPALAAEPDKIIEIDDEAVVAPALDDEEVIPGEEDAEDLEDDEATIDDEEVDPFNDKWEQ
jgi:hypothetical protein